MRSKQSTLDTELDSTVGATVNSAEADCAVCCLKAVPRLADLIQKLQRCKVLASCGTRSTRVPA